MHAKFSRTFTVTVLAGALLLGAVAAGAAERLVYIPLGSAGKVLVVDARTNAVVREIKALPAVHGLAGTPDGRFLIAGNYDERDARGDAARKPAGISEKDHQAHHAKRAEGTQNENAMLSTVSVVSTASGQVVRRIDVPGAVHHVAVRPDGKYAAVTHPNQDAVTVIDLGGYGVVDTIRTGTQPNYAVFSSDGSHLYVSNAGAGTISQIETNAWSVLRSVKVGEQPEHIVLSRDGKTLFVNNVEGGTVSIVDTQQGKVSRTVPIGSTLHGIDLSDDGKSLFVASLGGNKMVAVDLRNWTYRSVVLSPAPYHLATIRGTGKVYVSSADQPMLWIVDQKTLSIAGQIKIGGKGHQIVVAKTR